MKHNYLRWLLGLFLVFGYATANAQAPGTDCANPDVINSLPYSADTLNTAGFGDDYSSSDACGSSYMGGDDYVFSYTPLLSQNISITLTNTGTWVGVFLLDGCPDDTAANCVALNTSSSGNPSIPVAAVTGGTTYYIVVSTWPTPQTTVFDIDVAEVSCADPTGLTASNVTQNSADVSWSSINTVSTGTIEYGPSGFAQGSGTILTGQISPATISGLTANTAYDVYLQDSCTSGSSAWIGPISFTTQCAALVAPIAEGFESGSLPSCWSQDQNDDLDWTIDRDGTTSGNTGPPSANEGDWYAYVETSGSSANDLAILNSPLVDVSGLTAPTLSFDYHMYGAAMGIFTVEAFDGANWVAVFSDTGDQGNMWFNNELVDLSTYPNPVQVRFILQVGSTGSTFQNDLAIDDVQFVEMPACAASPSGLSGLNITSSSVDLTWTPGDTNALGWEVEYGPKGFAPGTGTIVATTTVGVTVSGLMPNTDYDFYVVEECTSGNFSLPDGPVSITTQPSCPNLPTGLTVLGSTSSTMDVTWTPGDTNAISWIVEYDTAGFALGTGMTMNVSVNFASFTGLAPNTDYQFYVVEECAAGDFSAEAGPVTGTTACNAVQAPLIEAFSGNSTPSCWIESGSESWKYSTSAGYAAANAGDHSGGGTNYAWIDGSVPNGAGQISTLFTPLVDVSSLTVPYAEFWFFSENTNDTSFNNINVEFWDGAAWNLIMDYAGPSGGWAQVGFNMNGFNITGPVQLKFTVEENGQPTPFYNDILFDDIKFIEEPGCASIPSNFQVNSATATDVSLFWTAGDPNAISWTVEYDTAGFTPGTGMTVNVSTPGVNITGLSPETDYEFYLIEECVPGANSALVGPLAATTACAPLAAPYAEGFEGGALPNCWVQNQSDDRDWTIFQGSTSSTATGPSAANEGTFYAYVETSGASFNDLAILEMPLIDTAGLGGDAALSFDAHLYGASMGTLTVEALSQGMWTPVWSLSGDQGDQWFNDVLVSLAGMDAPLAVRFNFQVGPTGTTFENDAAIDDVQIIPLPSCAPPNSISVTGQTLTSVDVAWNSINSGSAFEIEYDTAGFVLGTGTSFMPPSSPITITGLNAGTNYDGYIREFCANGDTSVWVPFTFTTSSPGVDCAAPFMIPSIPFVQGGFNTAGFGDDYDNQDACNSAYMGGDDFVFQFTAPADMDVEVVLSNTSTWVGVFVTDGCPDDTNTTCLAQATNSAGNPFIDTVKIDSGFTYFVTVSTWPSPQTTPFDIAINELTCASPAALGVSNVTTTTADVSWVEGDTAATDWVLEYGPAGFAIGTGTVVNLTATTYQITGLAAASSYDVYVSEECVGGGGVLSPASGPARFNTSCVAFASPFSEDFEQGILPTCWDLPATNEMQWIVNSGTTSSTATGPSTGSDSSTYYIYTETSGTGNGDTAVLVLPDVDITNLTYPALKFDYHMYGAGMGTLKAEAFDGTNWVTIWSQSGDKGDVWFKDEVVGLPLSQNPAKVRFNMEVSTANGNAFTNDAALDNIRILNDSTTARVNVRIELNTDNYGEETGIYLYDVTGQQFIDSIPPLSLVSDTTYIWDYDVVEGIELDFLITDAYGDGICCNYGQGSYYVTVCNDTVAQGGQFTVADSASFFALCTQPCADPVADFNSSNAAATMTGVDVTFTNTSSADAGSATYIWDFGDGNTSTQANPLHTYTANGTYSVSLVVTDQCGQDTVLYNVIIAGISIAENIENTINLYPNPTTSNVNLEFTVSGTTDLNLQLVNLTGAVVWSDARVAFGGEYRQTVEMDDLPKGVYLLQITTNSGTVTRRVSLQ